MGSAGPRSPHVLIIGAGMGGLFLAQFLRKRGIAFSIFERDASLDARKPGWAIGLSMHDDFASFMPDDVLPLRDANHLLPLTLPSQFIMYPPGGARIGVTDSAKTPCVRANRQKLRSLLLTGLNVQWGKKLAKIEEDKEAHTVTAFFEDGSSATGDLLVGADGTWSKTREHILGVSNAETLQPLPMAMIGGETTLTYTPDGAEEGLLEKQLRLGHSSYIAIRPGGTFFCGVDRVSPAGDAASFYWFLYMRDADAGAPDHWLRTASKEDKYSKFVEYTDDAGFEARHTEIVTHAGPAGIADEFQVYYDAILPTLPTHGGRIVLIGDAAHPTTPFRGEGAIMAIKDALQLTDFLAVAGTGNLDDSTFQTRLDTFQDEVTTRGAAVVEAAREAVMGKGGAADPKIKPRSWGFEVTPVPASTEPLGLGLGQGGVEAK